MNRNLSSLTISRRGARTTFLVDMVKAEVVLEEDTAASVTFRSTWLRVSFATATEVLTAIAFVLDYVSLKEISEAFIAAGPDECSRRRAAHACVLGKSCCANSVGLNRWNYSVVSPTAARRVPWQTEVVRMNVNYGYRDDSNR